MMPWTIGLRKRAAMIDYLLIGGAVVVIGWVVVSYGVIEYLTRPTDEDEG